ncbi:hypothetical protein D3C71_878840 [compost metagenome]
MHVAQLACRGRCIAILHQHQIHLFAQHELAGHLCRTIRVGLVVAQQDLHRYLLSTDVEPVLEALAQLGQVPLVGDAKRCARARKGRDVADAQGLWLREGETWNAAGSGQGQRVLQELAARRCR